VPPALPQKFIEQMKKAGLPLSGPHPFKPKLTQNRKGDSVIEKRAPKTGPKSGKKGYVDDQGRIWIKDIAHAGLPDHWDVQINDGDEYIRIDQNGNELT
jgi:hypothetical protein